MKTFEESIHEVAIKLYVLPHEITAIEPLDEDKNTAYYVRINDNGWQYVVMH